MASEDVLEKYVVYSRINAKHDFIVEIKLNGPQQVAVRKRLYYHHFIAFISEENGRSYLSIIHKINKNGAKMVTAAFAVDNFTSIKQENFAIQFENGKYDIDLKFNDICDFEYGLYLLGDYDYSERVNAVKRARQCLKKKDIYSFESFNCEHFTNYCFTGKAVSFQTEKKGMKDTKAALADGGLDALIKIPQVAFEKVIHSVPIVLAKKAASSGSSTVFKKALVIGTKPLSSGAIGAIVQLPFEVYHLAKGGIQMKKAVKEGRISQSDMDKEVTKRTFASATSIAGNFGAGVAGAAIGTVIAPGVGTILGGLIGGTIGELAGKPIGNIVGKGVYEAQLKIKNKIKKHKNKKNYKKKIIVC